MRFTFPITRPCPCGSGEPRRELRDAHCTPAFAGASLLREPVPAKAGICDDCEDRKRTMFDPRIFTADPYPADEPIESE